MSEKMNKIQIRAEVFSSINDICNRTDNSENILYNTVNKLVSIEDNDMLIRIPTVSDIKTVIFYMDPHSAPGPNGFLGFFL